MIKSELKYSNATMLKQEVAEVLFDLINPMPDKGRLLEIGTGYAQSTEFFSKLKPNWYIYSVDSFGLYGDGRIYNRMEHDKMLEINQKIQALGNVLQILGDSPTIPWELPIDVLFIDGNHTEDGCIGDFRHARFVRQGGIICFDDYTQENNPNNGVRTFVTKVLKYHPEKYEMIYEGYYCAVLRKL